MSHTVSAETSSLNAAGTEESEDRSGNEDLRGATEGEEFQNLS